MKILYYYSTAHLFNRTQTPAILSGQPTGHSNNLERLFRKQNKALRAITFTKWYPDTTQLFKHLNILTVYDINKLQTLCFVYKAVNNLLPKHFTTFFNLNINIQQHNTRQSSSWHFTFHRTNIRANSIKILGLKLWNSLGSSITSLPSFHIFKNRCFHSILNSYVQ